MDGRSLVDEIAREGWPRPGRQGMRWFPFGKAGVLQFTATIALPGLPLVLALIALEELLKRRLGALL